MHRAIPRIAAFTLAVGCGLPAFLLPLSGFLLTLPFLAVLALSLAEITPRRVALGARFVATALCLTLLILTERAWLLPPVPTGFLFVLLTALTFARPIPTHAPIQPTPVSKSLPLRPFILIGALWLSGLVLIACTPSPYTATALYAWTCAMFLCANAHAWPLALCPEWLGYTARRNIFVSKRIFRFQLVFTLLFTAIAIIGIFLLF